jgi:hypothetical protein
VEQPWETGWQPVSGAPEQARLVATKVVNQYTYHLYKDQDGTHFIEKGGHYYQVSPGAFDTIPPEEHFHQPQGIATPKGQT